MVLLVSINHNTAATTMMHFCVVLLKQIHQSIWVYHKLCVNMWKCCKIQMLHKVEILNKNTSNWSTEVLKYSTWGNTWDWVFSSVIKQCDNWRVHLHKHIKVILNECTMKNMIYEIKNIFRYLIKTAYIKKTMVFCLHIY